MNLDTFIKAFVCPNTLIRLWVEAEEEGADHRMLMSDTGEDISMEWMIIGDQGWASKYKDWKVIGVTDILCDSYWEAVNIVIQEP